MLLVRELMAQQMAQQFIAITMVQAAEEAVEELPDITV
jgi:hypothetical protein